MSNFEKLGIHTWLAKQCTYMALNEPTHIQRSCIAPILSGKHVVGGAATGSGKTAAFSLPILQILSEDVYGVFALVLTPSRELAYQIADHFIALGAPLRVRVMLAIGGVHHDDQLDAIKSRPHIVVATPGRLRHLLSTFSVETTKAFTHLRFLVLDEADRLTEGDIYRDVRYLLRLLLPHSTQRQVLMFSATMQPRLTSLPFETSKYDRTDVLHRNLEAEEDTDSDTNLLSLLGIHSKEQFEVHMCSSPEHTLEKELGNNAQADSMTPKAFEKLSAHIDITNGQDAKSGLSGSSHLTQQAFPEKLQQAYLFVPNAVKLSYLVAALRAQGKDQCTLVFANSCLRAELVRLVLQLLGFPVCSLNSLLTQKHRLDSLALFKLRIARIMVATDIAARGLDIPNVDLVIHYDIPKHSPTYVHRVGRTARAGCTGTSVSIITENDIELVRRIERDLKIKLALWKEKAMRKEDKVLSILDEVSNAKIQAKQQVMEQFGSRVMTLKEQAAEKRAFTQQRALQKSQKQQGTRKPDEVSENSTLSRPKKKVMTEDRRKLRVPSQIKIHKDKETIQQRKQISEDNKKRKRSSHDNQRASDTNDSSTISEMLINSTTNEAAPKSAGKRTQSALDKGRKKKLSRCERTPIGKSNIKKKCIKS
ncbi:unnamed protein product [Phytomonas sp. Hart1]|nr:unnamed protein product [Phytomonas sp. Hart1]|eukprot:CCW69045.1 unnamed protein product [Phytomonas sp. isolate Hart1]